MRFTEGRLIKMTMFRLKAISGDFGILCMPMVVPEIELTWDGPKTKD